MELKKADLFINLSKYKPSQYVTPLENFTTEVFAYILKNLLDTTPSAATEILDLFGIKNSDKIIISTQTEYKVGEHILRPDITVESEEEITFIEVKVNSKLRESILGNEGEDQLQDYQKINTAPKQKPTKVYSLSKNSISSSVKNNVRWYQIFEILKEIEDDDIIVKNFLCFLTENKMGSPTDFTNAVKNLITANQQLIAYLIAIYEDSNFSKNSKYQLGSVYIENDGIGFYIQDSKKKKSKKEDDSFFFLGILPEQEDSISFLVLCDCLKDEFRSNDKWKQDWKTCSDVHPIVSSKKITEITEKQNHNEKIEMGKVWLNTVYSELGESVEEKYI